MRELTSFPEKPHAERLTGYLIMQSVPASLEEENGEWIVWIIDDDDREAAQEILKEFRSNPDDNRYTAAVSQARKQAEQVAELHQKIHHRQVDLTKRWSGQWWYAYPVTYILIGITFVVAFVCTDWNQMRGGGIRLPLCTNEESPVLRRLYISEFEIRGDSIVYRRNPLAPVLRGEFWRPVTPIFIHFGVLHILFNTLWMRQLATAVEFVEGTRRFLGIVLLIAVLSNLAQFYWSGPTFGGMSGVVFGMIGYVWMKGVTEPAQGLTLPPNMIVWAGFWMVLCMTGTVGNIANAAHLIGFLVGVVLGARRHLWKAGIRKIRDTLKD